MIKLLGIPFDANSSFLKGPALAPPRIRLMDKDGSANAFAENGTEIAEGIAYKDLGDLRFESLQPDDAYRFIKQSVSAHVKGLSKMLLLGGDHSITFPIAEAFADAYGPFHVLHIDAHADLYENFNNNPYSHASPFARMMEKGIVQSLTQAGIRTLNTHQRQQAQKYRVNLVEMKNFNFDFVKMLRGPLYISLDLDGLDPAYAPGVSHHEPGGLSSRDLITVIQQIGVPVIGADIVEYNPTRDLNNMTAMVAYKLMKELIAKMMEH